MNLPPGLARGATVRSTSTRKYRLWHTLGWGEAGQNARRLGFWAKSPKKKMAGGGPTFGFNAQNPASIYASSKLKKQDKSLLWDTESFRQFCRDLPQSARDLSRFIQYNSDTHAQLSTAQCMRMQRIWRSEVDDVLLEE